MADPGSKDLMLGGLLWLYWATEKEDQGVRGITTGL